MVLNRKFIRVMINHIYCYFEHLYVQLVSYSVVGQAYWLRKRVRSSQVKMAGHAPYVCSPFR
jgi:hypothetical protein